MDRVRPKLPALPTARVIHLDDENAKAQVHIVVESQCRQRVDQPCIQLGLDPGAAQS
jgi:hypothetical protein